MRFRSTLDVHEELPYKIGESLSTYLDLSPEQIHPSSNTERYHDLQTPKQPSASLERIFQLMKQLNKKGMDDSALGFSSTQSGFSLRRIVDQLCTDIVSRYQGQSLQYIELGPEPVKTEYIIRSLLDQGVRIKKYIVVDINPSSKETMVSSLRRWLPLDRIEYRHMLFEDLKQSAIRVYGLPNLVTMLGIEEGNEHPLHLQRVVGDFLETGDLFVSEMQLLSRKNWFPIFEFSQSPFNCLKSESGK